jgi:hypothetical protein
VKSEKVDEPRGFFGEGDARKNVTEKEAREKEKQADAASGRRWRTTVMVRRRGEVVLPTSLRLDYEGGETQTLPLVEQDRSGVENTGLAPRAASGEPWRGRFKKIELLTAKRLVSATARSRGPAEARRQRGQQLEAVRARHGGCEPLGRPARVLAAAAPRALGALG